MDKESDFRLVLIPVSVSIGFYFTKYLCAARNCKFVIGSRSIFSDTATMDRPDFDTTQ